jgi:hypothetical protein
MNIRILMATSRSYQGDRALSRSWFVFNLNASLVPIVNFPPNITELPFFVKIFVTDCQFLSLSFWYRYLKFFTGNAPKAVEHGRENLYCAGQEYVWLRTASVIRCA